MYSLANKYNMYIYIYVYIRIYTYHKGDEKWPMIVNKQLFWLSALIPLNNNNDILIDF